MSTIVRSSCPVCLSEQIEYFLTAKDYTVSQENFEVYACQKCQFKFTQNIPDEGSIGPYYQSEEYISHSDTKEGVVNRLYHMARNYMLKSKKQLVEKYAKNGEKSLLDIGCGTGYFLDTMKGAGWQVQGIEVDDKTRQYAIDKFGLQVSDNDALFDLPKTAFDVVSMWHVLEHVHELDAYMEQIHSILKPQAHLVIAVPNWDSHDANKYGAAWAAWDVPRHLYHFAPNNMQLLAERFGFELLGEHIMPFDAFYVSMLSEKYKNGKGNLLGGVWTGGVSLLKAMSNAQKCSSVIYILKKS